jgi:hypothetical protein
MLIIKIRSHNRRVNFVIVTLIAFGIYISQAQASIFDWSTANNQVVAGNNDFSLTVDGITARAEAYTTEWNASNSTYSIIGRFPVTIGVGFNGTYSRGAEGLTLRAESFGSVNLSGREGCANGGCGIDNRPYLQDNPNVPGDGRLVSKSNFAVISFSQPVTLSSIQMDAVSNYDSDFWVATSTNAPNLNSDFITALVAYNITNHNLPQGTHIANDFGNAHSSFSHMVVGAPLDLSLGNFPAFGNQDNQLDSFNFHQLTVHPVPLPATWLFMLSAVGCFGFLFRQRNNH